MLKKSNFTLLVISILLISLFGCGAKSSNKLSSTTEILLTSANGEKLSPQENIQFKKGTAGGNVITVFPDQRKQKMQGIGSSFTESSAFVLAHLDESNREEVMKNIFSEDGADFTLTRTHIGACDFSVKGRYSYADKKDDKDLTSFSIFRDSEGFSKTEFPDVIDESYDLLPMIKEALEIKKQQNDSSLKIFASAWTAPDWMKDIEEWYIPGAPENNWQGTGGSLKEKYIETYADYLVKYLDAYKAEGVNIWGITPVNEPHGNNGQWESMHFSPKTQNDFIKNYLGVKLRDGGYNDLKLLIYDQNRDGIEDWTNVIFADPITSKFVHGVAVHWYESTIKVYEDVFDRVHAKFPDYAIIHTEGCIDDLGKDAPGGVTDPVKFKETNWFNNDEFWWGYNATDWAYSVTWQGVKVEDHPAYVPVHRYARNIIVSIDHWLEGWIDWNIVLDSNGGPNHVGNYCGAPIMIDTNTKEVYYTPVYHVLKQFSKTIRPGDVALKTVQDLPDFGSDDLHACATINDDGIISIQLLNTKTEAVSFNLQIKNQYAEITVPANAVETIRVKL